MHFNTEVHENQHHSNFAATFGLTTFFTPKDIPLLTICNLWLTLHAGRSLEGYLYPSQCMKEMYSPSERSQEMIEIPDII